MISIIQLKEYLCKATSLELQQILISTNHLFLYWKGTKEATRNTVPIIMRKKGFWITYIDSSPIVTMASSTSDSIITEEYIADSDNNILDADWSLSTNWRIVGESAGFASPTATTTTSEPGVPAKVFVNSYGEDTAKVFNFDFYIPKGYKGDSATYQWDTRSLTLGTINYETGDTTWGISTNLTGQGLVYQWENTRLRMGTIPAGEGAVVWGNYVDLQGAPGASPTPNDYQVMVFKQSDTQPPAPTGTSKPPDGWSLTPSNVGIWWMSVGEVSGQTNLVTSWSDPVQVTGTAGEPGNYHEYIYAKNITPGIAPAIDINSRNPIGWDSNPPVMADHEYMWMSHAIINSTTNALIGTWSNPIRLTGSDGVVGPRGQIVFPAGTYNLSTSYTTDDLKAPYVLDTSDPSTLGGTYYILTRQMTWIGTQQGNRTPYQDYLANGTDASWTPMGMYEAIYTKVLVADNGTINSTVFNSDYMFSKQGIGAGYQYFDPNDPNNESKFSPYLWLNMNTGEAKFTKGTIGGFGIGKDYIGVAQEGQQGMRLTEGSLAFYDNSNRLANFGTDNLSGRSELLYFLDRQTTANPKYGIIFSFQGASSPYGNIAMTGTGKVVMSDLVSSINYWPIIASNPPYRMREILNTTAIIISSNTSGNHIILPTRQDINNNFGQGVGASFQVAITFVCAGPINAVVWGRNSLFSGTSTTDYPQLYDWNKNTVNSWELGRGDHQAILLVYDGVGNYEGYQLSHGG